MAPKLAILILVVGSIAGAAYLAIRLDFLSLRNRRGLGLFAGGLSLVTVALIWQVLSQSAGYPDWFVPKAYAAAVVLQALAAAGGVLLVVAGIVAHDRFWHDERRAVLRREQLLALLENLQHDARQPYQLLELLNITLGEVGRQLPNSCGAILFSNRGRRQFMLTSSLGLSKEEIAALEQYPLDRNIVSQAVNMAEPLIAPGFDFIGHDGSSKPSRFHSAMVLPLVAGMEQIGALILFSEIPRRFDRGDAQVLTPVTEWLAERIRATRLTRELTSVKADRDRLSVQLGALHERIGAAVSSLSAPDPLGAFCRSLAGLFDSGSVHVCAIRSGRVEFLSHSQPIGELSQSYQTALIEAIDRKKPLLINQESSDDTGRDRVVASTLVVPLGDQYPLSAILLRRESGPVVVTDPTMQTVELVSRLTSLAVEYVELRNRSLTQRSGFDRIMHLLDPNRLPAEAGAEWFVSELKSAFPPSTGFVVLDSGSDRRFRAVHAVQLDDALVSGLAIGDSEDPIAIRAGNPSPTIVAGRTEIDRWLDQFSPANRQPLAGLVGTDRERSLIALCPLRSANGHQLVLIFARNVSEQSRDEFARLLTLACALYGFRSLLAAPRDIAEPIPTAEITEFTPPETPVGTRLSDCVSRFMTRTRISGDLYMVAGRPREIHTRLASASEIALAESYAIRLVESALQELVSAAGDEDVITVSLYQDADFVYLDLSRHRRHLQPVDRVSEFAKYRPISGVLHSHMSQSLRSASGGGVVSVATDEQESSPSYLSFKIPKRTTNLPSPIVEPSGPPRILVIDDQPVILDLVAAMCQTVGYTADCARSGEVGLQLAARQRYSLVLVDLAMPGLSGLEVARLLKRQSPQVPVVIMTGWEATLDRNVLSEAGVVEILYKPFRIEQLSDLLKSSAGSRLQN